MAQDPVVIILPPYESNGDQDSIIEEGIKYLNKRIRSSSQIVMVLAAGIVVPMAVEHSNKKKMHVPTVLSTYLTFLSGLSLRGLVFEFLNERPGPPRYVAIKALVHACAFFLVSLSFSLSLMMRMKVAVTALTVAVAALVISHRLWQCATTKLGEDMVAYAGCEEEHQELLELSSNITSMLFGGWFGMAFFYFQNYPEEARDARFLPSEYLTFFTSVAASLALLKAVPRSLTRCPRPVRELKALIYALVLGVVTTALVIAASKVGRYAALALVPEAVALAAWALAALPVHWPEWLGRDNAGGEGVQNFVSTALTLLLAVLTYRAKDGGMSSLYDEAFVLLITACVVAALGWRMVSRPSQRTTDAGPGEKAAAKILSFFTFLLLFLSVLAFLGVIMFGL